jgi:hypothetical protein
MIAFRKHGSSSIIFFWLMDLCWNLDSVPGLVHEDFGKDFWCDILHQALEDYATVLHMVIEDRLAIFCCCFTSAKIISP